jgi:dipeptidyl aminopeptidase/acylaminoacyl peptidase
MKQLLFILFIICTIISTPQKSHSQHNPSFEEVQSLHYVGSPSISPDGSHVAFTIRKTDWKKNGYDTEIWVSSNGKEPFQLTRTVDGSSTNPQWSPDGNYLGFTTSRGNKNQVYAIAILGGEAFPVSNSKEGVQGFEWSPDGKTIYYSALQPETKPNKAREDRYGQYEVDESEFRMSWLYKIEFDPHAEDPSSLPCYEKADSIYHTWDCVKAKEAKAVIDSVDFTIRNFSISPDGKFIAFTHSPDPMIMSFMDTDISLYSILDSSYHTIIENESSDFLGGWAPNSQRILYTSDLENKTSNFYKNNKTFIYDVGSKSSKQIGKKFDENLNFIAWNPAGIFFSATQKTKRFLFKGNPNSGEIDLYANNPVLFGGADFTKDGAHLAFTASHQDDMFELYTARTDNYKPEKITNMSNQIKEWNVADSKVINWKSKDGTIIEGVLHTPKSFDPKKKYPLLVMIHGGPTGVDMPTPILGYVYPVNQWLNKGAVVLRVNYRGSAGYGAAFRALNVENLGVGDAWDVLSGVDYLIAQGYVDEDRMGCMGWSQGGYISAFLSTTSDRFKAISVGAGISNWMTYYVNTDIHPFTRQYLKATPWENEEIYKKTSPMTFINNASTPTLIQHGEFDQRVPTPNAYELLQGLKDNGVPAKLIIYKGFGHGISKPKERLAAIWHNWQWFNKYLWDEEVEMPIGE